MKTQFLTAATAFSLGVSAVALQAQDALSIVKKSDEKMRGTTAKMELTLNTIRPSWKRSMQMKVWTRGSDFTLILLTAPAREKGVAFLRRKKEVWNWFPALERVIKLPPSMMNLSWMGTDFTNDDLVKESSAVQDYTHRLLGDTLIGGRPCHKIEMTPHPGAAVVWGKVVVCIDKTDFMELHARFYDEDGVLVNILNASEPRIMGGRLIPTRIEMIPVDRNGHKTEMIYNKVIFDEPIGEDFFELSTLKSLP